MKWFILYAFFNLINSHAEDLRKENITPIESETYFSVEPNQNTKIVTYHVQTKKFPTSLQNEFKKALASFSNQCWVWALPSYKKTLSANAPDFCIKFTSYTSIKALKPYQKEPINKKMQLTALAQKGAIQVQNFIWDGEKLQRVRNSVSLINGRSFEDFLMLWALK